MANQIDDLIRELTRLREIERAARQLLIGAPSYGIKRVYASDVTNLAVAVYGVDSDEARNHDRWSRDYDERIQSVSANLDRIEKRNGE